MSSAAKSDREILRRLRAEYDAAFRQWAVAMDQLHESNELSNDPDLSHNSELSMCAEESAILYRDARNRFANALLERCIQSGGGRPQSRAAADLFASDSTPVREERKVASGASFLGYRKPAIALAAHYCAVK